MLSIMETHATLLNIGDGMKKIAILTTTRADYGLLSPIIKKMMLVDDLEVAVLATGTHLSPDFGMTINEIVADGVQVDAKINILSNSDTPVAVSRAMGIAISKFSEYFEKNKPNALLVLGDRYECLAVCLAAQNSRIPIIHLHGGEITEGAIDNAIRHAITKLSYLHFASTEEYRNRIIQMGEEPSRVFNVGAVGVENALNLPLLSKTECESKLNLSLDKYALLTFHPVTLENQTAEHQTNELLKTISKYNDITFICTKANADMDGRKINELIEKYSNKYGNIKLFDSLGSKLYLSLMKNALFVVGNSSSGIIETPSFKIPTINIGDRQKGRTQANSIINCAPVSSDINKAITTALSDEYRGKVRSCKNPYEGKATSDTIVNVVKEWLFLDKLKIQKKFYDILQNK